MKVLILVLSAMREPWRSMLEVGLKTWDSVLHPQTETLYYCGQDNSNQFLKYVGYIGSSKHFFFSPKHDEELERVSARTLEAFYHALELEWDLMARVHSSCYVHKQNLVNYCETQSTTGVMQGLMTGGEKPFLWGGGHYLFSRDVIEKFVENPDKWTQNVMEDNALTDAAFALGIPITSGRSATIHLQDWTIEGKKLCLCYNCAESFEFTDWADIKKAHPSYFFRCKQDLKRHLDLEIFRKLKEHL